MNKTILFTPVGGTDPISSTNCYDGSMLHICRVYKPDIVIMYMSKEMLDYQEKDDRYRYCLDQLMKLQKRKMEYRIIERRNLTKVHEFDYYYQDFRMIIEKIHENMDDSDKLLLNVSSGTPAMKSGLLVLQTLGEFPAKPIQVATPEEKINEHSHKNYNVRLLWEKDIDNREGYKNRCKEVACPTLSKIKKEEIIKKHISVYDYKAAIDVADTLPKEETRNYSDLLYLANSRILLNFSRVDELIEKTKLQCLPVEDTEERKYFEYALSTDIKLKRGEYADFIRAITPLIVDLFETILKKEFNIDINDYCEINGNSVRNWSIRKLSGTVIGNLLDRQYRNGFKGKEVYSDHLRMIIAGLSKDRRLIRTVNEVRKVEKNIRNLAAHEIISITDRTIVEKTGYTGEKIMNMIKELFHYTGIAIRKEYWDSYDDMNQKILQKVG